MRRPTASARRLQVGCELVDEGLPDPHAGRTLGVEAVGSWVVAVPIDRDEVAVRRRTRRRRRTPCAPGAHLPGDVAHGTVERVDPGRLAALPRARGRSASCRWSGRPARPARSAPAGGRRPASSRRAGAARARTSRARRRRSPTGDGRRPSGRRPPIRRGRRGWHRSAPSPRRPTGRRRSQHSGGRLRGKSPK